MPTSHYDFDVLVISAGDVKCLCKVHRVLWGVQKRTFCLPTNLCGQLTSIVAITPCTQLVQSARRK
jgi:hypothetical protein